MNDIDSLLIDILFIYLFYVCRCRVCCCYCCWCLCCIKSIDLDFLLHYVSWFICALIVLKKKENRRALIINDQTFGSTYSNSLTFRTYRFVYCFFYIHFSVIFLFSPIAVWWFRTNAYTHTKLEKLFILLFTSQINMSEPLF